MILNTIFTLLRTNLQHERYPLANENAEMVWGRDESSDEVFELGKKKRKNLYKICKRIEKKHHFYRPLSEINQVFVTAAKTGLKNIQNQQIIKGDPNASVYTEYTRYIHGIYMLEQGSATAKLEQTEGET